MFPNVWNQTYYKNYIDYLLSFKNDKYKKFHSSLCTTKYEIIGINLPMIRKITKEISNTDYISFLEFVQNQYYEEVMIEGLIIASITDEKIFFKYFNNYINKIDNWAITDSLCNSLKILKNDNNQYFNYFKELALREEEFLSRIGLVTILNFYIKKIYLTDIFEILNKINSNKYYVNMAQAWLVCELYIFYPKETKLFLKKNNLNKFTQNKAISKIRESYRVSQKEKDELSKLKR